ncbi:MAG: iron transporter permease [Burkholderiaceae bacterium]|nr:iron transporter permease [Burkholderiaceae bacterium]
MDTPDKSAKMDGKNGGSGNNSGRGRAALIVGVLLVAALASVLLACVAGSVGVPVAELASGLAEILRGQPESLPAVLLELRLARALAAFATGASLALAGVMMQTLLRNPLADPYVLGVSSGASVGALAAMLLAGATWMVDAGAFCGAAAISLLLYLLARRDLRNGQAEGRAPLILLTGVILAAGCGALVTLMLSLAPDTSLRGMVFWLMGDLSGAQTAWLPWLVLLVVLAISLRQGRPINLLALHDDAAATLGVRVGALRKSLFVCATLLTASAVTSAGSIGFVGLIVPHGCRFAFGADHRVLLPVAMLAGGIFLVLADTLARTLLAPQQLPVGAVTALIGVPVFLLQLHQLHRK